MALIKEWLGGKSGRMVMHGCECDNCGGAYVQRKVDTLHRRKCKLACGDDICKPCMKEKMNRNIVLHGTKYLSSRTKDEKILHATIGGNSSALVENSGRFTTERWDAMTYEQQQHQVHTASKAFHHRLKTDPEYAEEHYRKIFKYSRIGYISKGHNELHEKIKHLGFKTHEVISIMEVDECHTELKIVIEYNGDVFHCNPKTWEHDKYNSAIKMTAGEKWEKDRLRYNELRNRGYTVIVIWESEWQFDYNSQLLRIQEVYNEIKKNNTSK